MLQLSFKQKGDPRPALDREDFQACTGQGGLSGLDTGQGGLPGLATGQGGLPGLATRHQCCFLGVCSMFDIAEFSS